MYGNKFIEMVKYFGHNEVIIHPICKSEKISKNTVFILEKNIRKIHKKLLEHEVKLFLENNSIIDGFFNTVEDLSIVFNSNPDIGLLLDIAHINNYEHLNEIIKMRFPECIHIADKHFNIAHEHITLGEGDIDFENIFKNIIPHYNGRIILEATETIDGIKKSKHVLDNIFNINNP